MHTGKAERMNMAIKPRPCGGCICSSEKLAMCAHVKHDVPANGKLSYMWHMIEVLPARCRCDLEMLQY